MLEPRFLGPDGGRRLSGYASAPCWAGTEHFFGPHTFSTVHRISNEDVEYGTGCRVCGDQSQTYPPVPRGWSVDLLPTCMGNVVMKEVTGVGAYTYADLIM